MILGVVLSGCGTPFVSASMTRRDGWTSAKVVVNAEADVARMRTFLAEHVSEADVRAATAEELAEHARLQAEW